MTAEKEKEMNRRVFGLQAVGSVVGTVLSLIGVKAQAQERKPNRTGFWYVPTDGGEPVRMDTKVGFWSDPANRRSYMEWLEKQTQR